MRVGNPLIETQTQGGVDMPRLPRYVLPGQPQHIIQRGNNRSPIFIVNDDYRYFQDYLAEACESHNARIHAYVLMTNHVHLLMTPENEDSISKVMQSTGRRYVQYFNHLYNRTGTLWEGRYKATLIDTETYLMICYRYIELNPIRANICDYPDEYRWSSYGANALGLADKLVTPHKYYQALSGNTMDRLAHYRGLFDGHLDERTLEEIRYSTQNGWVLGNDKFKDEIENHLQRRTRPLKRGGDHRSDQFKK